MGSRRTYFLQYSTYESGRLTSGRLTSGKNHEAIPYLPNLPLVVPALPTSARTLLLPQIRAFPARGSSWPSPVHLAPDPGMSSNGNEGIGPLSAPREALESLFGLPPALSSGAAAPGARSSYHSTTPVRTTTVRRQLLFPPVRDPHKPCLALLGGGGTLAWAAGPGVWECSRRRSQFPGDGRLDWPAAGPEPCSGHALLALASRIHAGFTLDSRCSPVPRVGAGIPVQGTASPAESGTDPVHVAQARA